MTKTTQLLVLGPKKFKNNAKKTVNNYTQLNRTTTKLDLNFTKINASSKGIESSVVSEYLQNSNNSDHNNSGESVLIRKRSSSLSFDENINTAHMQIIAAVHEDGLGPIEWWQ